MAKLKAIALTISSISAFSGAAYSHAATPNQIGMAMMRLNSSPLDSHYQNNYRSGSLWAAMRRDFSMNEVNPELVRMHENKFAANSAYFNRTIDRSKPYLFHIATEVKKRNMPAEIALLPFIESAFVTKAKSHVGASGLWQFMPATGRHYGLERTPLYDGRHDVYAATNAALNYLQYLYSLFGDWSLALAAYNWGEGNVGRAVNQARAQGLEPSYENLRMPNETRNYVPKLLAVRNIVKNPQAFGINVSDINNKPYFQTVNIDRPIDVSTIARFANISESELLTLNPAYKAPVFIPKANRRLLLPTDAVAAFEKNYRNADRNTLMSWDIYTPYSNTSLSTIAAETGMSVSEIKRLNGIGGNTVSAGHSILVAKNSGNTNTNNINFIDTDNTPDTYQSNMPAMAPVSVASNQATVQTVTVVTTQVTPKTTAPINFISHIDNVNSVEKVEQVAAVKPTTIPPVNVTLAKPSAPTIQMAAEAKTEPTKPVANEVISGAANTAKTDFVALNKAANAVTTSAPIAAVTESTPEKLVNPSSVVEIASKEPQSLASQAKVRDEQADPLMALAKQGEQRIQGTETTETETITEVAHSTPTAEVARTTRIAENRIKQQQRIEIRLARAHNNAAATQTVAAGTHLVTDGDTLFNIAKRYNLSVADLITVNNIRSNNIRKGQVLIVTAAPDTQKQSNVRNVAYIVRHGDTLNTIADRFSVDVNDIRRWNQNTRTITPGQRLKLMGS